jgi:hypothetical protein
MAILTGSGHPDGCLRIKRGQTRSEMVVIAVGAAINFIDCDNSWIAAVMKSWSDEICGQVRPVPPHERGRNDPWRRPESRWMSLRRFRSQQFVEQEGQSHTSPAQLQRRVLLRLGNICRVEMLDSLFRKWRIAINVAL